MVAIESAYHPWAGALHTLLDSLIDWSEDELDGQPSLLNRYNSSAELAERLGTLARGSRTGMTALPQASRHAVILAGMAGLYLSAPEAHTLRAQCVADGVLDAMEDLMRPALLIMRVRRAVRRPSMGLC